MIVKSIHECIAAGVKRAERFRTRLSRAAWLVLSLVVFFAAPLSAQEIAGPVADPVDTPRANVIATCLSGNSEFNKAVRDAIQEIAKDMDPSQIAFHDAKSAIKKLADADALVVVAPAQAEKLQLWSDSERDQLLDKIRTGDLALIGVAGAINAYPDASEWRSLFGASVAGMPWSESGPPVFIKSVDPLHPAAVALGDEWLTLGPLYQFGPPYQAKNVHVISRVNVESSDFSQVEATRSDQDYAAAWAHFFSKGRVFYTALGGTADAWEDEAFQNHLLGGIGWAVGKYPASRPLPPWENREYKTTKNGVRYYDVRVGDGAMPKNYDTVTLEFIGRLANGKVIVNTYRANEPFPFAIGMAKVIRGLEEGIMSMRVGGKRVIEIPPALAYGAKGWEAIPPNTLLIYEIELIKIN